MFQSKESDFISSSPESESENTDDIAFEAAAAGFTQLPSSHTPTDYIGSINMNVPFIIKDAYADFKFYDSQNDVLTDLYEADDASEKIKTLVAGVQSIRIPANKMNTILTDSIEIEINGSETRKNYGLYYAIIKPKYVQSNISNITARAHIPWSEMSSNDSGSIPDLVPLQKRRTIYECVKTDFESSPWNFESDPNQSGRLYGSVCEIWNSAETILKQVKIMSENKFSFDEVSDMQFVLSPDLVGYDSSIQSISVGDVIRVFPRETYFEDVVIEISYKDKYTIIENMVAFMLNDIVRDVLTGSYDIYDSKGFRIDEKGRVSGNIINSYQITATDRLELRKRIRQ